MIEFLNDYPTAVSLAFWITVVFCIVLCIECLNMLYTKSVLCKVLGIVGVFISIAVPIGLTAVGDEIHNYRQSRTCIYINHKIVDFGIGERDYELIN